MFDINNIVNAAINAAVNARLTEVLQQHANIVAALAERITALEGDISHKVQVQHANIVAALAERIDALENQAIVTSNAVDARIAALENNPAQGVEPAITIDEARMVEALNSQEWFWEKLQNRIDAATEQAVDDHCSTYDHDNYDEIASKVDDLPDLDDYVTRDEVRSEIEDVLNNATLSLSI